MTCREKLAIEHPGEDIHGLMKRYCPTDFNYESTHHCPTIDDGSLMECDECWNRKIPDKTTAMHEKDFETCVKMVGLGKSNLVVGDEVIEHPDTDISEKPKILDSGNRRQFETGAVRDIQEGKGRCDLLPLDVVAEWFRQPETIDPYPERTERTYWVLINIQYFKETGTMTHLYHALNSFLSNYDYPSTMFLEVAKHFEEGAKKYGENNWQKGIPVRCYIDSAVRHYLKFLRGDKDEPHDRAFCWNIMCAIWTCKHKPELNEYAKQES